VANLTDDDVKRLRELLAKATPGPWRSQRAGNAPCHGALVGQSAILELPRPYNEAYIAERKLREVSLFTDDDADLIAAMRNALPDLLDEIDRLRAELAEATARARRATP
jgi:hypothetical protein